MIASPHMFPWPPRAARRLSSGAAGAVACGAAALWVSFGALSFVDVDKSAPYVGILPPFVWLAALVAAGAICVVAFRPPASAVAPTPCVRSVVSTTSVETPATDASVEAVASAEAPLP